MRTFFRAVKRVADRLDRTAGFDAPAGTRPYRSLGDAFAETKQVLDALDEDAGLTPRGTYERSYVDRESKHLMEHAKLQMSALEHAHLAAAEAFRASYERSLKRGK